MESPRDQAPNRRRRAPLSPAPGLVLLFQAGDRCDLATLGGDAAGDAPRGYALSHHPVDPRETAELMIAGLHYELVGLAPGPAARVAAPRHGYDVMLPLLAQTEAMRVLPAETGATATARPVLRTLVALGCELAGLPGLVGLGWEAAGTAMSPAYYLRLMQAWLQGGAFPGLGLAALVREAEVVRSEGLALFLGYELALSLAAGESPAGAARLALRGMHALVEEGVAPVDLAGHLGLAGRDSAFSADGGLFTIG